jgi:hypothetical protein
MQFIFKKIQKEKSWRGIKRILGILVEADCNDRAGCVDLMGKLIII